MSDRPRNVTVVALVLGCWLLAGCSRAPQSADAVRADPSPSVDASAGSEAPPAGTASESSGAGQSGTAGSGSGTSGGGAGSGAGTTSGGGSAGAGPGGGGTGSGGGGAGGTRPGTPIAILPFDAIGDQVSAFLAQVKDRIDSYCGGDAGCIRANVVYESRGDEDTCKVVRIEPRKPTRYGQTVTATVRCEPEGGPGGESGGNTGGGSSGGESGGNTGGGSSGGGDAGGGSSGSLGGNQAPAEGASE